MAVADAIKARFAKVRIALHLLLRATMVMIMLYTSMHRYEVFIITFSCYHAICTTLS